MSLFDKQPTFLAHNFRTKLCSAEIRCFFYIIIIMYLMYYLNEDGKRVYTLKVRKLYIYHIVLSVSISRKSSVLSRLFFSLCWNTQRNTILISIENSSSRNSPPAALFLFPLRIEQKTGPDGKPTLLAHPARFSPDDKFSKQRVACKKRFGLLLTQQPEKQF